MDNTQLPNFSLAYYSGDRKTGSITIINHQHGKTSINHLPVDPASQLDKLRKPILVGLDEANQVILFDPESKQVRIQAGFPADTFPAHIYPEPNTHRDWFMNDGDKQTGNDTVNCGESGSSVTVIENTTSNKASFLKTICVGRGHHQAAFAEPSVAMPHIAPRAYISNLTDGTISVIANNPTEDENYLTVLDTINLCQPEKEQSSDQYSPNNAFPHGLVYSPLSGKLYCLNNGYGNIAVINPENHQIETLIPFKGHSNLFGSPDGRYLIGRGADRKSNANHVIAKITALDVTSHEITDSIELQDIYLSKYFFSPAGKKLYLTTAISGSPEQQQNLQPDVLLVFDMAALPKIKLIDQVKLGSASGTLDFLVQDGKTTLVFSSNSEEGVVAIVDGNNNILLDKIQVNNGTNHSRLWTLNRP